MRYNEKRAAKSKKRAQLWFFPLIFANLGHLECYTPLTVCGFEGFNRKYGNVILKKWLKKALHCSGVSTVDFEQVNVGWVHSYLEQMHFSNRLPAVSTFLNIKLQINKKRILQKIWKNEEKFVHSEIYSVLLAS